MAYARDWFLAKGKDNRQSKSNSVHFHSSLLHASKALSPHMPVFPHSEMRAMLDRARVYDRLQRQPPEQGWEPTLNERHHVTFLQGCLQLAPIPAVSESWLANMVKVGPLNGWRIPAPPAEHRESS